MVEVEVEADLTAAERAALSGIAILAIADGELAWRSLRILEHCGHGPGVALLIDSGLVELWEVDRAGRPLDGGPYVTLTPLGAWRAGLSIIERGADERPRWDDLGQDEEGDPIIDNRPVVLPRWPGEERLAYPECVPDPRPGPELLLDDEGAPVLLFGCVPVEIDRRIKAAARKRRRA